MLRTRSVKTGLRKLEKPRRIFSRRKFGVTALSGIAGLKTLLSTRKGYADDHEYISQQKKNTSNMKLAMYHVPVNANEEEMTYIRQFGIEYVCLWVGGKAATAENFIAIKKRFEKGGLKVWSIGNSNVHNVDKITLNLPGREEKIAEYITYLRNLNKAGIHYTTYGHMADGVWHTGPEPVRGGVGGKSFDLEKAKKYGYLGHFADRPTHGRFYTKEEIWDNYIYFIKKVVPVAEEENIRIGIHPDDPPYPVLAGVPRCIFTNFDGYKRAFEIANSPNIGMCLCVGTWLAGGDLTGKDVVETIRYFGGLGKIFKVHIRNVESPLPNYRETWMDDGYMDLYKVVKALREVNNYCAIFNDHYVPGCVGGRWVGFAHGSAYLRALLERANEEVQS
ncbi:mannonate dehydratase [Candidatus Latescibacterota bacterium]